MKKHLISAMLLLIILSSSIPVMQAKVPVSAHSTLKIIAQSRRGIQIEVDTPSPVEKIARGKWTEQSLPGFPGWVEWDRPGDVRLPVLDFVLGVPPGVDVTADAVPERVVHIPLKEPLGVVPLEEPVTHHTKGVPTTPTNIAEGRSPSPTPGFPKGWVLVGEPAFIRHQRVVRITVLPFHPNAGDTSLSYAPRIRLTVNFNGTISPTAFVDEGPFERVLKSYLLNYEQAREWRLPEKASVREPSGLSTLPTTKIFRVKVNKKGIYRLTYSDLRAAGMSLKKLNPSTCWMARGNREIAIQVVGGKDGRFDPGDEIRFYGEPATGIYTDENVYWLSCGEPITGQRMPQVDGTPGSAPEVSTFRENLHREENHFYVSLLPKGNGKDHWFWTFYRVASVGSVLTRTFTADVPSPATGSYTATLTVDLQGAEDIRSVSPDHHIKAYVNGTLVGDALWDGDTTFIGSFPFPQTLLVPGTNQITMYAPGDMSPNQEGGYINWFSIKYRRTMRAMNDELVFASPGGGRYRYHITGFSSPNLLLYDITDPFNVRRVLNTEVHQDGSGYTLEFEYESSGVAKFLALGTDRLMTPLSIAPDTLSHLRLPDNQADYLIIAHRNFWDAAQRLAKFHESQGLHVKLIDVQDIYDEFNGGVFSAEAIKDFLEYTYRYWQPPAPTYVLLFGDGSSDFRNYMGNSHPNFIPPLLRYVDPFIGETASDNRYVTIAGDDQLPDMLIGRLPVDTPEEAAAVVDKIISYDSSPTPGNWRKTLLFVADNPDSGGDFPSISDLVISTSVPEGYNVKKVYYGVTHPRLDAARRDIKKGIDDGALIVNYTGHAAIPWWAAEMLFGVTDVPSLSNGSMLPVMLPMTCYEGSFHNPQYDALGEVIVRAAGRGAIASWSATGLGVAHGHDYLDRGFLDAVFKNGITSLGGATLAGKLELYRENSSGTFYDLLDTYVLLGDPYTHVAVEAPGMADRIYMPLALHVEGGPVSTSTPEVAAPTPTPTKKAKPTHTPTPTLS